MPRAAVANRRWSSPVFTVEEVYVAGRLSNADVEEAAASDSSELVQKVETMKVIGLLILLAAVVFFAVKRGGG